MEKQETGNRGQDVGDGRKREGEMMTMEGKGERKN